MAEAIRDKAVISHVEAKLNKALGLVGDVMRYDRVFVRDPSVLNVLRAEKEQSLSAERLATNPAYATRDHQFRHADDYEVKTGERFNSNRISRLSSGIVIYSTAAVMLAGTQVDTPNGTGPREAPLDEELPVAVLLAGVMGRETRGGRGVDLPVLLDEDKTLIDESYIRAEFGETMLAHVKGIQDAMQRLNDAGNLTGVPKEYASAAFSVQAARLREAAKVVSLDHITDLPEGVRTAFKNDNNLTSSDPERELLEREYDKLSRAKETGDIHRSVGDVTDRVLMHAVEIYQGAPAQHKGNLWGDINARRGWAYGEFNSRLPINQHKTDENALGILDTYKALLLVTRYHQDALRKDGTSILSHVLDTVGFGSRTLDDNLRTRVTLVLMLHDLIEDGGRDVANKDASLRMLSEMFGGSVAFNISEMSDNISKDVYVLRALQAVMAAPGQHQFTEVMADAVRSQDLMPGATDAEIEDRLKLALKASAFTLTTSGPKLADVVSTIQKNLEEPQENAGYWRGSGARIGWIVDDKSKGYVARELYSMIATGAITFFAAGTQEKFNQTLRSGHNAGELNAGLLNVLGAAKDSLDKYMVQNLTILADEFGLDEPQRKELVRKFTDKSATRQELAEYFDRTFTEGRLVAKPMDSSTIYKKGSTPENAERSYENLFKLRGQFEQREALREMLRASAGLPANHSLRDHILATTSAPDFESKRFQDVVVHYDRQMGREPRITPEIIVRLEPGVQAAQPVTSKVRVANGTG